MNAPPRACSSSTVTTPDHEITLFHDMDGLLATLEREVDAARERVWIETYIYRHDSMGRAFAELLASAAARGIDVRLLYDAMGCQATDTEFFDELRARGVKVTPYRPIAVALRSGRWWPRDHSRVIVIDDQGFTGGAAWGDEWLPVSRGGQGWHDVCSRVRGPCVEAFARIFRRRWAEADRVDAPVDIATRGAFADLELVADSSAGAHVVFHRHRDAIQRARERVWIENAYFFPPVALLEDLYAAVDRGVDVRIIVPHESDLKIIDRAARDDYARWTERGLAIHEYLPSMMHSKFAVIDDDWATVGTFNANATSVMWANEVNLFVYDRAFVAEVAKLFERDLSRAQPVACGADDHRSFSIRTKDALSNRILRFLEAQRVDTV